MEKSQKKEWKTPKIEDLDSELTNLSSRGAIGDGIATYRTS